MEVSDLKKREYVRRLMLSRMRILQTNGFYGLLLMHANFALDSTVTTAATDGDKIFFAPEFMDKLSDGELDFVLMHEIMHIALQHCARLGGADPQLSNIACDIVVNSNILKSNSMNSHTITLKEYGESMHLTPSGDEGYLYTAEQVYAMLLKGGKDGGYGNDGTGKNPSDGGLVSKNGGGKGGGKSKGGNGNGASESGGGESGSKRSDGGWDDHGKWGSIDYDTLAEIWKSRVIDAAEVIIKRKSKTHGDLPAFAKRLLDEINSPQTDWRAILQDFVQEEVNDYSFTPPDKRYDGPFFLPDYNEKADIVEDILFMIDTSASMSDRMISVAYDEVKGAIDQFNGALKGWLGFFDGIVIEPKPFENIDELKAIRPIGGGGTNFHIIFSYIKGHMQEKLPVSIIILTDGYAPFPAEAEACGIPVLWLINNEDVNPPWGKIARLKVEDDED